MSIENFDNESRLLKLFIALISNFPAYPRDWQIPFESREEKERKLQNRFKQIKACVESKDYASLPLLHDKIALPDLESALEKARKFLNVEVNTSAIAIEDNGFDFIYMLTWATNDPEVNGESTVFSVQTQTELIKMIDLKFWIPADCPCIVCRSYIHPRAPHQTIPLNTLISLRNTIDCFANESLQMQHYLLEYAIPGFSFG
jgi:hypothetical protein